MSLGQKLSASLAWIPVGNGNQICSESDHLELQEASKFDFCWRNCGQERNTHTVTWIYSKMWPLGTQKHVTLEEKCEQSNVLLGPELFLGNLSEEHRELTNKYIPRISTVTGNKQLHILPLHQNQDALQKKKNSTSVSPVSFKHWECPRDREKQQNSVQTTSHSHVVVTSAEPPLSPFPATPGRGQRCGFGPGSEGS